MGNLSHEEIARIAAQEGVKAYRAAQKKDERLADPVKRAKSLIKEYRAMKSSMEDGEVFTREEQAEIRWRFIEDLTENRRNTRFDEIIKDEENRREDLRYKVFRIEKAARLYLEECEKSGLEEKMRRYRVFFMHYMDEKEHSPEELSRLESMSIKTIYRDLNLASERVALYILYG